MSACLNGHTQIVELLFKEKVNPNVQVNDGWNAFMLACLNGQFQIVELLLKEQVDPNVQKENGWNALMLACLNGHTQIVELLLKEQVDLNVQDKDGWNAFMSACQNGHTEIVELLLKEQVDPNVQNNNGVTAFMLACYRGHTQIVKLLLKEQVDPNVQDKNGCTALIFGCINTENDHSEIVELLLEAGADLKVKSKIGSTALACAVSSGQRKIAEKLLKAGATTNEIMNIELDGASLKMSIIESCVSLLMRESDLAKLVQLQPTLIEHFDNKLQINFVERLKESISKTNIDDIIEILHMLLEATPQPEDDPACLIAASLFGNVQAVDMLLKAGYNPKAPLSSSKFVQAILPIITIQAPVLDKIMKMSYPSLLFACCNGHLEVVKLLLEKIQQKTGGTFLMIASEWGHNDIVTTLLENGANPNICDNDGANALHHVLLSNSSEDNILDIIQTLLSWNINVNAQNNNGVTPLMIASGKGYTKVSSLLKNKVDAANIKNEKTYLSVTKVTIDKINKQLSISEKLLKLLSQKRNFTAVLHIIKVFHTSRTINTTINTCIKVV